MPVTLQLAGLKYKNSQGQFQSADCLKGEDADISIIAPDYSELTFPVDAGELCTHDLKLYRAKQEIQTSENWTESHWDERTIEEELAAKYTKPAGGIPASDLADGVIPDIIDDEAGAGDTDVTFSADKLTTNFSSLSNALNQSTSATNSDIGKAHSPKTVVDGKVTEWQYVEVGGGGGTSDYSDLQNKPQINGVTLSGNKTSSQLGLPTTQDIETAVDDWLDEYITNPDSPPLDRSLSSSSAAAPADIVGDMRLYTISTDNMMDGVTWANIGGHNQSDPIPVEYGKKYTTNFQPYNNRIYLCDSTKTRLGNLDNYSGVSYTDSFSTYDTKRVYSIDNAEVAYIQFYDMTKPSKTPLLFLEGDVDLPYPYVDEKINPNKTNVSNAKTAIVSEEPIGFQDLEHDLRQRVGQLGWKDQPISTDNIYSYNSETCPYGVVNGNIVVAKYDGFSADNGVSLLFNKNINKVKYDFQNQIITNANYRYTPYFVLESNNGHTGTLLNFSTTGGSINGISYIYSWNVDGTTTARSNAYKFIHDYLFVSVEITRNSDSFDFVFVDTEGTTVTKHHTFAQLGIVNPDYLGFRHVKRTTNIVNGMLLAANVKTSAASEIVNDTVTSPMNGASYDAWGDSYTAGNNTYVHFIAERTGCTAENYGVSGNRVSQMYERMQQASSLTGEYVSVLCGVNDFLFDTALATFKTDVQNVCSFITTHYTTAKACWILPPQIGALSENTLELTLEDYVNAIAEVCAVNSIPVLDLYHSGNWYGTVSAFQTLYMSSDLLHPNSTGQNLLAGKIQTFLENL